MIEKVEALSVERDRLQAEREDLKTKNDDLQDEIKFGQATRDGGAKIDGEPDSGTRKSFGKYLGICLSISRFRLLRTSI